MKRDVDLHRERASVLHPFERVDDGAEQADVLAVALRPPRSEPNGTHLEHEACLHDLGHRRDGLGLVRITAGRRPDDERPASDPRLHEPSGGKRADRLAYRRPAHPEVGGQCPLRRQSVSRLEASAQDEDQQLVRHELVRSPRKWQCARSGLGYRRLSRHRRASR